MKKQISPKIVSLIFSVLVICFAIVFYAFSWTGPKALPPGGNVPAPLNSSRFFQQKLGGLMLNTGGAEVGLIVAQGKVGIGTASPSQKLDVSGNIVASGTICDRGGSNCIGGGGGFGVRTNKDSDGNTFAKDNVYKATSDGFLTVYSPSIPGAHHQDLYLYNDFNNPPITLFDSVKTGAVYAEDPRVSMDGVPIVKNTYWKVVHSGSGTSTIFWTPIGSGVCVKQ